MCKITKENDSLQRQTENKDEDSQELQCNKNIPELRFPEFKEEWKEHEFGTLFTIKNGLNKGKEYFNHGTPILNYIDVNKRIFNSKNTIEGTVEVSAEEIKRYCVKNNDLFLTRTSETSDEIGLTSSYNGDSNNTVFSGFILRARPKKQDINSLFYAYYLRTNKMRFNIIKYSSITTRALINSKNLSKMRVKLPDYNEQKKISTFLSAIDKKIGFMEKEINKQSKYMKKIRENILNDNSDNSNKVQLKEICIINKGKQLNKTNMINDGKYYVLNGGKTPSGFTNSWNVPENTISISEGGNSCGFVNYNVQKFYCGGHCYYLTNISDEIDPLLLYHCLKMNENKIMNLRVGSGLPNIQKKDLEKYKLYIPTKNHEKITYLLNNINLKIDLNKEKLNHLKQFKKGLLQKMFC